MQSRLSFKRVSSVSTLQVPRFPLRRSPGPRQGSTADPVGDQGRPKVSRLHRTKKRAKLCQVMFPGPWGRPASWLATTSWRGWPAWLAWLFLFVRPLLS